MQGENQRIGMCVLNLIFNVLMNWMHKV